VRPWERASPRPWKTQQPIYPRAIAITRPNPDTDTNAGAGIQDYSGVTEANESNVVSGLPASIQQISDPAGPEGKTPTDAPNRTVWRILIPAASAALGLMTERDVVTDDLGKRYVVIAAYWNSLGYRLRCELLEA
jgi:hypothetical protein